MQRLYSFLFYLSLPLLIVRLGIRGLKNADYWKRWPERFGFCPTLPVRDAVIWIHAVSVGEVEASRPLIDMLLARYPTHHLLVTTMTPTGSDRVKKLFKKSVSHCYLPYDLPFAVKHFLRRTHPNFGIIMETEVWPNFTLQCQKQSIPLALINARLSERSAQRYAYLPQFSKQLFNSFRFIAAQSQYDKDNLQQLGVDNTSIHVVGNLKYELHFAASLVEQASALRMMWDNNRPVWVAASTHEGEEDIVLQAARQVKAQCQGALLVIVPRHPERFDKVTALAHKSGFKTVRRSDSSPCTADTDILIVDSMGELPLFYAASDIAFVGGSLVPQGGHNILEPAALGRAIITGPHTFNFKTITQQLTEQEAVIQITDAAQLAQSVTDLLHNAEKRAKMGEAGKQHIAHSQGASMRLANLIRRHIALYEK